MKRSVKIALLAAGILIVLGLVLMLVSVFQMGGPDRLEDQLEDYFLHRDDRSRKAGKHEYSPDELHKDSKWSPEDYIRAEDRRKRESDDAKKEKTQDFAAAVQIAKDNDLGEWAE